MSGPSANLLPFAASTHKAPAGPDPIERLAAAIEAQTLAIRQQSVLLEVLLESTSATNEARLLGISEKTVRRRREERRAARLLITTR